LTSENSRLNEWLEKLKAQLSALKQKLGGLQTPSTSLPAKDLQTK
jgi:predicted nuclease with TOPRIM domain